MKILLSEPAYQSKKSKNFKTVYELKRFKTFLIHFWLYLLVDNDYCDLKFIPLMDNVNKIKATFEVIDIANNYESFEKHDEQTIRQCQYVLAHIIANRNKRLLSINEVDKDVKVIYGLFWRTGRRINWILQKKGIKEVAKNLKDTLSDEDIAERTGL